MFLPFMLRKDFVVGALRGGRGLEVGFELFEEGL